MKFHKLLSNRVFNDISVGLDSLNVLESQHIIICKNSLIEYLFSALVKQLFYVNGGRNKFLQ